MLDDIKKYSSMGKLSVFVGAGVSRLSGFPSWTGLVQGMADEVGYTYKKDTEGNALFSSEELLKVPQILFLNKGEKIYRDRVLKGFANTCIPNEVHNLILSLHPNHILTTNYDTLIEETAIKFGRNFSILNSNDVVAKADTTNYIVKVHGDFSSEFVLKEQDYLDYENNYILIDNIVKTIFATNLVVFVGYGLNDYNIKLILNWVKRIQSDSFVMPVFIHIDDKLNENELMYQEGRGLRILDCNQYTDSDIYTERYSSVLKQILSYNGENCMLERSEKLQYIYNKILGVKNLNFIRREDFRSVFRDEYELNDEWKITNKTKLNNAISDKKIELQTVQRFRIDYFEDFFENKEEYESINKIQYDLVQLFLEKSGVTGIENDVKFVIPQVEINSLAFESNFEEMKNFCINKYVKLEDNYKKAYFLAQLGEYAESYRLFTEILNVAKRDEQWDIYYFSQINRQYLVSIIMQMKQFTSGALGILYFGADLKLFDDDFIDLLNQEMSGNKLESQFQELPYEFKTIYKTLEDFSNKNCYLPKYFELTKSKFEIEKSLQSDTISLGLSNFDKIKLEMLDTTKFLYENMILFTGFNENKLYIKNVLIAWLEAYSKEALKNKLGPFGFISNSRYGFTITDIILITKCFKKDDINYIENKIDFTKLPFEKTVDLENYISDKISMYIKMFNSSLVDADIFLWKLYHEELKNLLLITPYFIKNNNCKLKVIDFLVNYGEGHFHVSDRVDMIYKLIQIANAEYASPIIEKWFIDKFTPLDNREIPSDNFDNYYYDIGLISQLLRDTFHKDKYNSDIVSNCVMNSQKVDLRCIRNLYPILSYDAKKVFDEKHPVMTIYELMQRGYEGYILEVYNEKKIIENYFESILKERKECSDKKIIKQTYPNEEESIAKVAMYMLLRDMPYEFTKTFNNICDEYDFLLNPKGFDIDKFQRDWLFRYSDELIKKFKNNEQQRKILISNIEQIVMNSSIKSNSLTRLFNIYIILVNTH